MKRKISAGLAVAASLIVSLSLAGSGNDRRKESSSTRGVVIDGRSFVRDESSPEDASLLTRELGRRGVRLPDTFILPQTRNSTHLAFEERLRESRPRDLEAPRLPAGLIAEHTLRMEGEEAAVDLVFGNMTCPGSSVRSRLLSSGWRSLSTGKNTGETRVLQSTYGKETVIVCLDEAEGTFLLFREVDR